MEKELGLRSALVVAHRGRHHRPGGIVERYLQPVYTPQPAMRPQLKGGSVTLRYGKNYQQSEEEKRRTGPRSCAAHADSDRREAWVMARRFAGPLFREPARASAPQPAGEYRVESSVAMRPAESCLHLMALTLASATHGCARPLYALCRAVQRESYSPEVSKHARGAYPRKSRVFIFAQSEVLLLMGSLRLSWGVAKWCAVNT